ncbi:hypothetical protein G7Y89_g9895 [Cudoniella acicularis]|uniref:2EXR domain-containing protein n=1 Tax=Cudoniella acicularis TaxID=354080 RepID=A0A8H4W1G3_9HELO|nr:hypothetical protein G7Y89_g9895 [Cudoniella acicularis]
MRGAGRGDISSDSFPEIEPNLRELQPISRCIDYGCDAVFRNGPPVVSSTFGNPVLQSSVPSNIPLTAATTMNAPYCTPSPHAYVNYTGTAITNLPKSDVQSSLQPQTFYLFSQLPPEIRLKIWIFSIQPRVIELRTWKPLAYDLETKTPLEIAACSHSVPAILHTNKESRAEALRMYQLVEIGISTWRHYHDSLIYVPWRYHAANPNADRRFQVYTPYNPETYPCDRKYYTYDKVMPFATQKIYIDYSRDTVYIGSKFGTAFLEDFLESFGRFQELPGLQYLALNGNTRHRGSHAISLAVRKVPYRLKGRPLKEVRIVPDDTAKVLHFRRYKKSVIELRDSPIEDTFGDVGQTEMSTAADEDSGGWLQRMWKDVGVQVKMRTLFRRYLNWLPGSEISEPDQNFRTQFDALQRHSSAIQPPRNNRYASVHR